MSNDITLPRTWWTRGRPFSFAELVADGIVHGIGMALALALGSWLLTVAAGAATPREVVAIAIYVLGLLLVLGVSLAFNMCPITAPAKRLLARFDQAAIFLFIAASYTPYLMLPGVAQSGLWLTVLIWCGAAAGMALKLFAPDRFGRVAIIFYLALGWSGIAVIGPLTAHLPPLALSLLFAGGAIYSVGVVFHLWERLRFHNAIWHACVVAGASLHLVALVDCLVGRV